MHKHTPKPCVKVTGKMNENDAGTVGKLYAIAAILFAACSGLALLLHVIRWW